MYTSRSQRWREMRSRYVDDLSVIDTRHYVVDALELSRKARVSGRDLPRKAYPKILAHPHPELALQG